MKSSFAMASAILIALGTTSTSHAFGSKRLKNYLGSGRGGTGTGGVKIPSAGGSKTGGSGNASNGGSGSTPPAPTAPAAPKTVETAYWGTGPNCRVVKGEGGRHTLLIGGESGAIQNNGTLSADTGYLFVECRIDRALPQAKTIVIDVFGYDADPRPEGYFACTAFAVSKATGKAVYVNSPFFQTPDRYTGEAKGRLPLDEDEPEVFEPDVDLSVGCTIPLSGGQDYSRVWSYLMNLTVTEKE